MEQGVLTKGYSGFYYVKSGERVWECKLRGRFRLKHQSFLPGDLVKFTPTGESTGVIEEVLPRHSELVRPPVANVDQAVIVMAMTSPEPDLFLLDRFLILVEASCLQSLICFNKADLASPERRQELIGLYAQYYRVIATSAVTGEGVDLLKEELKGKISVFAGPSGVGKSSLLNAVNPGLGLKTGTVSDKIKRGRHTTRHVELLELPFGGFVADTPGFSVLDLPEMKREELPLYYPEMGNLPPCRFTTCLHNQEPGCSVKEAVAVGEIDRRRYEHYLAFLAEVIEKERRY